MEQTLVIRQKSLPIDLAVESLWLVDCLFKIDAKSRMLYAVITPNHGRPCEPTRDLTSMRKTLRSDVLLIGLSGKRR